MTVTGRRTDGYHELFSLFCPLDLHDRLYFKPITEGIRLSCDHPDLPTDASNLVHRAARAFYRHTGIPSGIAIHLEKTIPMGAGLGGGSSNAATVLKTLNQLYGHPLDEDQLVGMAVKIGADVPFFIGAEPAIATGIGDILSPFSGLFPYAVLVIYPNIAVSTAWVYQNLDLGLTNCKKTLKYTLLKQEGFIPARHMCNDLESVTTRRYPRIAAVKKALMETRTLGALMSGSGSTVFGLYKTVEEAKQAKTILEAHWTYEMHVTTLRV